MQTNPQGKDELVQQVREDRRDLNESNKRPLVNTLCMESVFWQFKIKFIFWCRELHGTKICLIVQLYDY